jgi:hypothetical protein
MLLPGIEIELGWQTDRIFDDVPSHTVTMWFSLAAVWVAVIAGGLVGDENLWIAVGQLVVASFALLWACLR